MSYSLYQHETSQGAHEQEHGAGQNTMDVTQAFLSTVDGTPNSGAGYAALDCIVGGIVSKHVKSLLIRKLKGPLNPSIRVTFLFWLRTGDNRCLSERTYLEQSHHRFVSQAVNDMEFGRGKPTTGHPGLLHASAGIADVGSCSVFFYIDAEQKLIRIVGIEHHPNRETYRLDYTVDELGGSGRTLSFS